MRMEPTRLSVGNRVSIGSCFRVVAGPDVTPSLSIVIERTESHRPSMNARASARSFEFSTCVHISKRVLSPSVEKLFDPTHAVELTPEWKI